MNRFRVIYGTALPNFEVLTPLENTISELCL